MSIKEERKIEKKNGMDVIDNITSNGKNRNMKMAKYEPGGNVRDIKYEIYKKALKEDRIKDIFPDEPMKNLMEMFERYLEETGQK
jgi:hypothetical protein|tara:strand:+ start:520 stop:774 length:255 start_codon:yes stop_codon:yes gene_type:complete